MFMFTNCGILQYGYATGYLWEKFVKLYLVYDFFILLVTDHKQVEQ